MSAAARQEVGVGIIGGGLMGREIALALARWPSLVDHPARPVLRAVCDINPGALGWFEQFPDVANLATDYHQLLGDPTVDVVYAAVRHDAHEQVYLDSVDAGKDLLGEKPFGIDLAAAERIVAHLDTVPDRFVRCSSEMPFFPGSQVAYRAASGFEEVIEARCHLLHSSDFDRAKPLNWKRQAEFCGPGGVLADLGMHACHLPLRLGWEPEQIYAVLQSLVDSRPGPDGTPAACDTFENALLTCKARGSGGRSFPLLLEAKRIDPGQKNTFGFKVTAMEGGVEFSTRNPAVVRKLVLDGKEQSWLELETGSQHPGLWPTTSGAIFEFGFSDAILAMCAAFFAERAGGLGDRFSCATPAEVLACHRMLNAALESHADGQPHRPTPVPAGAPA